MPDCEPVFRAGGRVWTQADVRSAAEFRGELAPLRAQCAAGLACVEYAAEEGFEVPTGELQQQADALRYALDLETAEATEAWLAAHGVDMDDLTAHLERRSLRERFARRAEELTRMFPPEDEDLAAALDADLLFSGDGRRLAEALARRVAVAEAIRAGGPAPDPAAVERARADLRGRLGTAAAASRAEELEREATFLAWCAASLTPDRTARELRAHRAELIRVECESAVFRNEGAAREAVQCVRHDGESLADAARRAGAAVARRRRFLDEFPPELRTPLLSARRGDLLGPWPDGAGGQALVRVADKAEPDASDPELAHRLERMVLEPLLEQAVNEHVQWLEPVAGR